MGSRKLEELYREFDAYEDDDLMEAMDGGMGFREDDDDDNDEFRRDWSRGGGDGYGERRGVKGTGRYAGEYRRRRRY